MEFLLVTLWHILQIIFPGNTGYKKDVYPPYSTEPVPSNFHVVGPKDRRSY